MALFKILAIAAEYRTYEIYADTEHDARWALEHEASRWSYDRDGDCDGAPEVQDIWEVDQT